MANEWSKLVKKVYDDNKHKAGYKLQHAMKDAKKFWKGSSNNKSVKKQRGSRRHPRGTRRHRRH
jgi:hypothetical protein